MKEIKFSEAILEAIDQSMQKDKSVILMGLGITDPKSIFGTTKGLLKNMVLKELSRLQPPKMR